MTNNARKKERCKWKRNILRIACWNITSWNNKDIEVITELDQHKIDICALSETKKKGKGTHTYENYILIYSGRNKEDRGQSGVGLLIHKKFETHITDIKYISDRLLRTTLKFDEEVMHIIPVYAPDTNKPEQDAIDFYESLQQELDQTPQNEKIVILGDMNARIGNLIVHGVKQRFNEETIDE